MKKIISFLLIIFVFSYTAMDLLRAKQSLALTLELPEPNQLLMTSKQHSMPVLRGLKLDPNNPRNIEFYVDSQDMDNVAKEDVKRLINYFFAGLTVADEKLWVNLSPYEQDRIIDEGLSVTELGKDMLGQDYILKQLSSSLTHPDTELGKEYWAKSVGEAIDAAHDNFNKIWISPDKAEIYTEDDYVFVTEATFKVESEKDYLAYNVGAQHAAPGIKDLVRSSPTADNTSNILIPEISKEVNYGKNFSKLRQIYNSLILAKWFKQNFHNSFYKNYINNNTISGIDLVDPELKDKVYALYCDAFKKGVYDISVKEKNNKSSRNRRTYFSGGIEAMSFNPSSSSAIKSLLEIPVAGKLFAVKGDVAYQTSSSISNKTRLLIEASFLAAYLSISTYAQTSELPALKTQLFVDQEQTIEDWRKLEKFMLNQFRLEQEHELIKSIMARIVDSNIPLTLATSQQEWDTIIEENYEESTTRAFVIDGKMYLFLDYVKPKVVFHELVHVLHKNDIEFYQSGEAQINSLPMFKNFNKISLMINQTDDPELKENFDNLIEYLSVDYMNPIKSIWYHERSLEKSKLDLVQTNEFELNKNTRNYAMAINEFFAHLYEVAIAYELGMGQDLDQESYQATDSEHDVPSNVDAPLASYRYVDVELQIAKILYTLKIYPEILKELEIYYSEVLKLPTTKAFKYNEYQDNYGQGVVDDIDQLFRLAEYYDYAGNDNNVVSIYNKLEIIIPLIGFDSTFEKNMLGESYYAAASYYATRYEYDEVRRKLLKIADLGLNDNIASNLRRADLLLKIADTDAAEELLDAALDIYDDNYGNYDIEDRLIILTKTLKFYSALGSKKKIDLVYRRVEDLMPTLTGFVAGRSFAETLYELAELLAVNGYLEDAVGIYRESLDFYADNTYVDSVIVELYLKYKKAELAVDYLEKILRKNKERDIYHTLADVYFFDLQDTDKAIGTLLRCLKKYPGDFRTTKMIVDFYYIVGDSKNAEKYMNMSSAISADERLSENIARNGGIDLMNIKFESNALSGNLQRSTSSAVDIISLEYLIESIDFQEMSQL